MSLNSLFDSMIKSNTVLTVLSTCLFYSTCLIHEASSQQPLSPLWNSFDQYQIQKKNSLFGIQWIRTGPVVNSARVESVQADPTRPGVLYAAFGSGGLWKTTNNGITWNPIFEGQATYGIGDIALAPSNPNVIYVGTGESLKKARNFTIPGTGVYRSDDAGKTWRHLGLNDSWHIGEISVHPEDPDTVLVAVLGHFWSRNPHRGLYLTEDGGKSWKPVLKINDQTGGNDVVWSPSNPNVAYASVWENNPGVAGKNSGIYRSSDRGRSWSRCVDGLPRGDQIGRIGLAVSSTNSKKVYALVDNREFSESAAAEIYRSIDGGKSWKRTHESKQKFLSRIGWYFTDIYVDPHNDEEIYALGVRLAHSVDGGKSFQFLGGNVSHVNPSAASGMHLDQCELWIHPKHPQQLLLGNDGGLYQSFDGGKNWKHFNNIPTGEFYDIEISQDSPYLVFAGAQDDATVYGPTDEFDPNTDQDSWKYLWIDPWNGGDGCVTRIDPSDANTVYFSAQEGAFRRKNMATDRSVAIRPKLSKEFKESNPNARLKFNFVAPMILSPHNPKRLYLGGNYLFTSKDRGDHWNVISHDFASSEQRSPVALSEVNESPRAKGLLYVGTDRGNLWVSENDGKSWEERTGDWPDAYVRSICPSSYNDSRVYLAMSGLNYDNTQALIFCSENRGKSWKNLARTLPNEPVNVVIESPSNENILFAGTFRGVYISLDRGDNWSLLGKHQSACSIADLAIHKKNNQLIVGTHGRGVFRIDLNPIESIVNEKLIQSQKDSLFPVPTAFRPYISNTHPSINFKKLEKITISYWVNSGQKIHLSVLGDKNGKPDTSSKSPVLFSVEQNAAKGLNQFRWDLATQKVKSPEPYFINYVKYLPKGSYWLRLKTESGETFDQPLRVKDRESIRN